MRLASQRSQEGTDGLNFLASSGNLLVLAMASEKQKKTHILGDQNQPT
jgi:hypothetical protein